VNEQKVELGGRRKPARSTEKLPGRFEALVRRMPPQAIADDRGLDEAVEMIDRLMAAGKLTRGQELYLETLVQLVQAYENAHHAIEVPAASPRSGTCLTRTG
jgi:hypothetical protein